MQRARFFATYLLQVALIAAGYYVTGRLGLLLAIPPGFATAIWPASGIALAGVLYFGYPTFTGVVLGSFCLNMLTASGNVGSVQSLIIACCIATGAGLQALLSAWLVRRVTTFPNAVEQVRDILAILLLGGLAGCMVNSVIGTATLFFSGLLPVSNAVYTWLTWWAGDVMGVAIFTPILLLIGAPKHLVSLTRKLTLTLILSLVFSTTVYVFILARQADYKSRYSSVERVTHEVNNSLQEALQGYANTLGYIEGLFRASDTVTAEDFELFTQMIFKQQQGIRSLSWSPLIKRDEREAFEQQQQQQGQIGFMIKERDEAGNLRSATPRDLYYPLVYLSPVGINPSVIGVDTYSPYDRNASARRHAIDESLQSHQGRITSRIIMQPLGDAYGFMMYRPVYRLDVPDHIIGIVSGSFSVASIMKNSSAYLALNGIDIVITEATPGSPRELLYDSRTHDNKESLVAIPMPRGATEINSHIAFGGHEWELNFSESAQRLGQFRNWGLWMVLAGGMSFVSILSAFLLLVSGRTQIVERLVEQKITEVAAGHSNLEKANRELSHLYEITKEQEETFRSAMEYATIGKAIVSVEGKFRYVNPTLSELLGYSRDELLLQDFQTLTHPEDLESDLTLLRAALAGEIQNYRLLKRYIRKDNELVWGLLGVSLVRDDKGAPIHFIAQIQDVTELKHSQDKQQQLVDRLTQSNTELERFAYVASHDMQEPLRMVANFSELLSHEYSDKLDDDGKQYMKLITDSAGRMQSMITDLLEYARIGRQTAAQGTIYGESEVRHVLDNLAVAIAEHQAVVTYDEMPNIQGNAVQFMSLLQNLISNAIKYQPAGSIPKVHISAVSKDNMWEFKVSDNGIGMEEADLSEIFEPFKRLHTWQQYPGTGIGLAVCKRIAENHQGKIWAQSIVGQGSQFFFTWPKS